MKAVLNDEEVIRQFYTTRPNDCFETLYNRYVRKVYNRCYSLTKDSEKAQDFTHDIFLRMFANLGRFQERSTFSTWLYSISYNYCMDQLRASNRMNTYSLDDNLEFAQRQADDNDSLEDNLQHLNKVVNSLAPQESMILKLKYEEGLDVRQIATRLNLNDSAVKMRLKRSRDKARQLYESTAY